MSTDTGAETRDAARSTETPFRYGAALAEEIELRWQDRWEREGTFHAPEPAGAGQRARRSSTCWTCSRTRLVPDCTSGTRWATSALTCFGRYLRMTGRNVLHAMGYDAFGLPAEQHAVQTGTHPRTTTEANITRYRAQMRRLGLAHDDRRSVATTDVGYYRWTQWIFGRIFNAWYDTAHDRARPITDLVTEFEAGIRPTPDGRRWDDLDELERRRVVDSFRLAYVSEAPVNWCPGLGTVLANEEVTAEGRSERGNFPVFRRRLRAVDDADHRLRRSTDR